MPALVAKHELQLMGMYWMDVLLNGTPVQGSPVTFKCVPGSACVSSADGKQKSHVALPEQVLYEDTPYELVLHTVDRLGNKCTRSTCEVSARLVPAKPGDALSDEQDPIVEVCDVEGRTFRGLPSPSAAFY